jgi:hypothetical protein
MTRRHPLSPILFLVRNPGRSLPLTLVLALAVLTIASVVALLNSIDRTILKIYDYNRYFAAITPRGSNRLKPELMERLTPGAVLRNFLRDGRLLYERGDHRGQDAVCDFRAGAGADAAACRARRLTLKEGRYPRSGEAGVALSNR